MGGQCPGSIFIDTVHSMAEVICDCEVLRNAVNELYRRLYDKKNPYKKMVLCQDLVQNKMRSSAG